MRGIVSHLSYANIAAIKRIVCWFANSRNRFFTRRGEERRSDYPVTEPQPTCYSSMISMKAQKNLAFKLIRFIRAYEDKLSPDVPQEV